MPQRERRKGAAIERAIVSLHADNGLAAAKCSRSGYAGHDLEIAGQFRGEVKARKGGAGFTTLERWLGENDVLFLKRDRHLPLVTMTWSMYALLMQAYAEQTRDDTGDTYDDSSRTH